MLDVRKVQPVVFCVLKVGIKGHDQGPRFEIQIPDRRKLLEEEIIISVLQRQFYNYEYAVQSSTTWPSGLRRYVQVVFFVGVGSNPTVVITFCSGELQVAE